MLTSPPLLHPPTLPAQPALQRHLAELEAVGYTLIPGFLDRSTTAALRRYMDRCLPAPVGREVDARCRRHELRHPMPEPELLAALVTDEHLVLATALLAAQDLRLLEQVFCRTDPMPEPWGPQAWHIDRVMFPRHRRTRPRQLYHQIFHALSDVDRGGAAFMIVPGSHHRIYAAAERFADRSLLEYDRLAPQILADAKIDTAEGIEVLAREGDVIVFDPMCLHAASVNSRAASRYIYACSFYDASAAELHALWEGTYLRNRFPEGLSDALPSDRRRLLLR